MNVAKFKEGFKELKTSSGDEQDVEVSAKSLIDVYEGRVYAWNSGTCGILTVSVKDGKATRYTPTDTPLFQLTTLKVSPNGRHISLSGPKGIYVVELPATRSGPEVICRVFPVGERFYSTSSKNCIQQVHWHPDAVDFESYLTVLSSDNTLRIFNVEKGEFPDQSVKLSGGFETSLGSSLLTKTALGDGAVSFCFGTAIEEVRPIYCLYGDGRVYGFFVGLGDYAIYQPKICGPFRMEPESNTDLDFCAILHLQPSGSSPPILILAANSGILHHCIILHDKDGDGSGPNVPPDMTLHNFESVELDFSFFSGKEKILSYPITLTPDLTPNRYFCSHLAGVHCVGMPMVAKLSELALMEDQVVKQGIPMAEEDAIVEHLVCTAISQKTKQPINGVCIFSHAMTSYLCCSLSGPNFEVKALSKIPFFPAESKTGLGIHSKDQEKTKESFEHHVAKLLQRPANQPIIFGGSSSMESEELLNIITKSTKVLREEYLVRLEKVRVEIEKKVQILRSKKTQQDEALLKLRKEKRGLCDKATQLSETYQDLQDNNEKLTARLENVLSKIQNQMSIRSDAELKMDRKLLELSRRMNDLKNGLEQIRTKEKYQLRQMREAKDTLRKSRPLVLGQKQLQSIKDVLQSNANDISDLMKQVKAADKNIALV